jgi:hypothetical protein
LDVKKRFTEEQIIGFLRAAEAGWRLPSCAEGTASQRPVITFGVASLVA